MIRKFGELKKGDHVFLVDGVSIAGEITVNPTMHDECGMVSFDVLGDECYVFRENTCSIGTYNALFTSRRMAERFIDEKLERMMDDIEKKIKSFKDKLNLYI